MDAVYTHDAAAFAAVVDPSLFTWLEGSVVVVADGVAKGHTIVDQGERGCSICFMLLKEELNLMPSQSTTVTRDGETPKLILRLVTKWQRTPFSIARSWQLGRTAVLHQINFSCCPTFTIFPVDK